MTLKLEPFIIKGTKDYNAEINASPHYTDKRYRHGLTEFCLYPERLVECEESFLIPGLTYEYSDRLSEWNRQKFREAVNHAKSVLNVADKDWRATSTANYFQEMLRYYYDNPNLQLIHIIAGYNWSNGYPYLIYGFIQETNNG